QERRADGPHGRTDLGHAVPEVSERLRQYPARRAWRAATLADPGIAEREVEARPLMDAAAAARSALRAHHVEDRAGHQRGLVGQKPRDRLRHLLGPAGAAER